MVWVWRSTIGGAVSVLAVAIWSIMVQVKWEDWGLEDILVRVPDEEDESTEW